MTLRYRNTGFMRQLFIYHRKKYCGLEFNKRYIRYYRITPEGALGHYKEIRL
jgi:hypothetical protein